VADARPAPARRRALRLNDEPAVLEPPVRANGATGACRPVPRAMSSTSNAGDQVAGDPVRGRPADHENVTRIARGSVHPSTPRRIAGAPCSSISPSTVRMCGERLKISAAIPHM